MGAGNGSDTITDFSGGNDQVGFCIAGLDNLDDLRIGDNASGHAVIKWYGGQVTLIGVSSAALSDVDFIFG